VKIVDVARAPPIAPQLVNRRVPWRLAAPAFEVKVVAGVARYRGERL